MLRRQTLPSHFRPPRNSPHTKHCERTDSKYSVAQRCEAAFGDLADDVVVDAVGGFGEGTGCAALRLDPPEDCSGAEVEFDDRDAVDGIGGVGGTIAFRGEG